jgi:hypothetical protein
MVGREHDCVGRRAVGAKRGQRAARGPDGIEFVNLNCLFSPARFFHDVSPLSAFAGRFVAVITSHPYNWRDLGGCASRSAALPPPTAQTLVPGALKSLLGFLKLR